MAKERDDKGKGKGKGKGKSKSKGLKKKYCKLCLEKVIFVDYKDEKRLGRFVTDRGKIVPHRVSGTCSMHQKQLTTAIKRARILALLPFTSDFYR